MHFLLHFLSFGLFVVSVVSLHFIVHFLRSQRAASSDMMEGMIVLVRSNSGAAMESFIMFEMCVCSSFDFLAKNFIIVVFLQKMTIKKKMLLLFCEYKQW